jgi:prepilin-type processing-associated H-X9-DG protein
MVLVCPSVIRQLDGTAIGIGYAPTDLSNTNYQANAVALGRKITSIRNSSQVVLADEAASATNAALCRPMPSVPGDFYGINNYQNYSAIPLFQWLNFPLWHNVISGREDSLNVHNQGVQLLYVDGHAGYAKYKDLRSSTFGLTPDEPWSLTNSSYPDSGGNAMNTPFKAAF